MTSFEEPLIVITGAAGFIGSALVRHLNDKGKDNLILVDELGQGAKWQNLVGKRFVDIITPSALFSWLENFKREIGAIIHLGANSSTVETNADALLDNNYRFSVRLADYALSQGYRFIYASSAATYGDGSCGFCDEHNTLELLIPLNMYGYSKHLFDLWLKNQGLLDRVVGLKYFNIFGPNEGDKGRMASAVYHLYPKALSEGVVSLFQSSDPANYPDGGQLRDFLYVKDAVAFTTAFLENNAAGIFNIGSGVPRSWKDLASALFDAVGKPCRIEYIPMPKELIGKYQNYTCADMSKTKAALGKNFPVITSLEAAVGDYVKNYLIPGKRW